MKHRIWLEKPAKTWDLGLPIGNGRIGAMVMGKVNEETIFVNEETLWYGPKRNRRNPDTKTHLEEIRELLFQGEIPKAQFLAKMAMTSTPKYMNPYQPVGDLRICILDHRGSPENYRRELDVDNALAEVSYTLNGEEYRREHLVSHQYNVLAVRMTTTAKEGMTFSVNISRKPFEENTGKIDEKTAATWGQCGQGGVCYFGAVRLAAKEGKVSTMGDFVYVEGAKEAWIYLTAQTDFQENTQYRQKVLDCLDRAEQAGYEEIRRTHLEEFHSLYNRVELELCHAQTPEEPTDQLLERLRREENNNYLAELLFHFGRYLLISSSYDCVLPANLQGIWNGEYVPAWQSEYTININTEMNYWLAEVCHLPECHQPLFDLIERLSENGKETARELYGCRGTVAHHNTNLWATAELEGIFDSSPIWPMGVAWLSSHLYEHYLFTQDREFLRERALPVLRESIAFYRDYLIERDGQLLTGPSLSPENSYRSESGQVGSLCIAPTMDSQILRLLFGNYIEGCQILGIQEDETLQAAKEMIKKLPATQISQDGRIQEWYKPYEEIEPGHRHVSHLFGLHPGKEITQDRPDLFAAASKTLEYRLSHGGGHTGWSRAWITNFYARLKQPENFLHHLNELLRKSTADNFLDVHPPFQIDGNFGAVSGIAEALVQSHGKCLEFLPALPKEWHEGRMKGVCLRGGIEAELSWKGGELTELTLCSSSDQTVCIRVGEESWKQELKAGEPCKVRG